MRGNSNAADSEGFLERGSGTRPAFVANKPSYSGEDDEGVYDHAIRVAWYSMEMERICGGDFKRREFVSKDTGWDLFQNPVPEPAPGACIFPLCGKPRKVKTNSGTGGPPLCEAHARQWTRKGYLVPTRKTVKREAPSL